MRGQRSADSRPSASTDHNVIQLRRRRFPKNLPEQLEQIARWHGAARALELVAKMMREYPDPERRRD